MWKLGENILGQKKVKDWAKKKVKGWVRKKSNKGQKLVIFWSKKSTVKFVNLDCKGFPGMFTINNLS